MKQLPYRIWILMLGIAVAMIIGVAAILFNDEESSSFSPSESSRKVKPGSAPEVLIKKALEKVGLEVFKSR